MQHNDPKNNEDNINKNMKSTGEIIESTKKRGKKRKYQPCDDINNEITKLELRIVSHNDQVSLERIHPNKREVSNSTHFIAKDGRSYEILKDDNKNPFILNPKLLFKDFVKRCMGLNFTPVVYKKSGSYYTTLPNSVEMIVYKKESFKKNYHYELISKDIAKKDHAYKQIAEDKNYVLHDYVNLYWVDHTQNKEYLLVPIRNVNAIDNQRKINTYLKNYNLHGKEVLTRVNIIDIDDIGDNIETLSNESNISCPNANVNSISNNLFNQKISTISIFNKPLSPQTELDKKDEELIRDMKAFLNANTKNSSF